MNQKVDTYVKNRCNDCNQTVTVVDEPAAHRGDDPHWAEAYTQSSTDFQHCWKCGRVLWSPL